jgi:hypothetical protein
MGQLLKVQEFRLDGRHTFGVLGLRPDFDLNHVGICLFVDDPHADDL